VSLLFAFIPFFPLYCLCISHLLFLLHIADDGSNNNRRGKHHWWTLFCILPFFSSPNFSFFRDSFLLLLSSFLTSAMLSFVGRDCAPIPCRRRHSFHSLSTALLPIFLFLGGAPSIPFPRRRSFHSLPLAVLLVGLGGGAPSIPRGTSYELPMASAPAPYETFLRLGAPPRLVLLLPCFTQNPRPQRFSSVVLRTKPSSGKFFYCYICHPIHVLYFTNSTSTLSSADCCFLPITLSFLLRLLHFSFDSFISPSTLSLLLRLLHCCFDSFIAALLQRIHECIQYFQQNKIY
jgi:hypothetical protein